MNSSASQIQLDNLEYQTSDAWDYQAKIHLTLLYIKLYVNYPQKILCLFNSYKLCNVVSTAYDILVRNTSCSCYIMTHKKWFMIFFCLALIVFTIPILYCWNHSMVFHRTVTHWNELIIGYGWLVSTGCNSN